MAPKNQRWWLTEDHVEVVIGRRRRTVVSRWSPTFPASGSGAQSARRSTGRVTSRYRSRAPHSSGTTRSGRVGASGTPATGGCSKQSRAKEFAFITDEGGRESTLWRYRFEPAETGTRVTESYEVRWIPAWARILDVPLNRHKELVENMRTTLERLKVAAAEARTDNPEANEVQA